MERDGMEGTEVTPKNCWTLLLEMDEKWRRLAGRNCGRELELLLRRNEELERGIEQRLQRLEHDNAPGHGSKSQEMPPHSQSAVADEHVKRTLQLRRDSLEELKQNLKKPAREQQIRQDKELPAWLIPHALQTEELNEPDDSDVKSKDTPHLQAAAADPRDKRELQLRNGLSEGQMQDSEKPAKKRQLAVPTADDTSAVEDPVYDLFFAVSADFGDFVGVGCIIKDADGQVVSENRKCIGVDISHHLAEYSALSIGLKIAQALDLRRINAHGNPGFIYSEVQRQVEATWTVEQLAALQKQIKELDSFSMNCVSRAENKEATNLAKYATEDAPTTKRKSSLEEDIGQQCLICLGNVFPADMVSLNGCGHQFCFICLSLHVESEILDSKVPVRCPLFTDCTVNLDENECKRLVSPTVFDTYLTRLLEAAIPDSEKVYCPFPSCSTMIRRTDKNETNRYAASSSTSIPGTTNLCRAECTECHRLFCVECHVPWHTDLTCRQYQDLPRDERDAGDRQLFELAKDQKWRKCENCLRLISLAGGCFHITCRCGNEFCYICGTNYQDKKQMCTCLIYSNDNRRQMIDTFFLGRAQNPQERILPPRWLLPAIHLGLLEERNPEARVQHEPIPEERTPEAGTRPFTREMIEEANHQASIQQRTPEDRTFRALHRAMTREERNPEANIRPIGREVVELVNDETIVQQLTLAERTLEAMHRTRISEERNREVRIRPNTPAVIDEANSQARIRERNMEEWIQAIYPTRIPGERSP